MAYWLLFYGLLTAKKLLTIVFWLLTIKKLLFYGILTIKKLPIVLWHIDY